MLKNPPVSEKWIDNSPQKMFSISHHANHLDLNFFGMHHRITFDCKKQITANYARKLAQLRNKYGQSPINVLFLVRQNSKWSYQSLYEELERNPDFNPLVAVSVAKTKHLTGNEENELQQNYDFFTSRGIKTIKVFENNSFLDLQQFDPDIVFYDQPWELPIIHEPLRISQFALTAYCPYGITLIESDIKYQNDFHPLLWQYFIEDQNLISLYSSYDKTQAHNYTVVGHPKLDTYLQKHSIDPAKYWRDPKKFKIIYAPHHSFENNPLCCATFKYNGQFILDWAKSHPETTWIFKPHPRFIEGVIRTGIMTKAEIDDYYREWQKIGSIYTQGDYFGIFKSSDLMVTDCLSFLAEYLPSGHPLIHLINTKSVKLNVWGEKICSTYYNAYDNNQLQTMLERIVINKYDPAAPTRQKIAQEIFPSTKVANLIIAYLTKQLS